jgi:hypothetical protein
MNTQTKLFPGLNGNQLKILALIAMTIDHIGCYLYPTHEWMRIVGRLAFPIFAYMIAEGARYTKNRKKYLGMMFGLGVICQIVYYFAMGSLFQCILITFTFSIVLIYALDYAIQRKNAEGWILLGLLFIAVFFLVYVLPKLLSHTDYNVDYGIWGVLFPVFVYLGGKNKWARLALAAIPLVFLALSYPKQEYALFALVPLALYNGTRGKWKMKYLFYIYYPLHLVVIYAVGLFM